MNTEAETCYACRKPMDGGPRVWRNVAPDAASDGTMMPFHPNCVPACSFYSKPLEAWTERELTDEILRLQTALRKALSHE